MFLKLDILIVQFQPDSFNWAHEVVVSHALLSKWCAGELTNARADLFKLWAMGGFDLFVDQSAVFRSAKNIKANP